MKKFSNRLQFLRFNDTIKLRCAVVFMHDQDKKFQRRIVMAKYKFSETCYWDSSEQKIFRNEKYHVKLSPTQTKILKKLLDNNGCFVSPENLKECLRERTDKQDHKQDYKTRINNQIRRNKKNERGLLARVPEINKYFHQSNKRSDNENEVEGYKIDLPPENIIDDSEFSNPKLLLHRAKEQAERKNIGDIKTENSARWVFYEGFKQANSKDQAKSQKWAKLCWEWAKFEEKHKNIGKVNKEYSARWILEKSCNDKNLNLWLKWAKFEEKHKNIGKVNEEYSARWIFYEACVCNNLKKADLWLKWAKLEEKNGNIGEINKKYSARWIFHEACVCNNLKKADLWLKWAKLEEKNRNIGKANEEYSARWIFYEACVCNDFKKADLWLKWAEFEEKFGNIEDINQNYSLRWILNKACQKFPDNEDLKSKLDMQMN